MNIEYILELGEKIHSIFMCLVGLMLMVCICILGIKGIHLIKQIQIALFELSVDIIKVKESCEDLSESLMRFAEIGGDFYDVMELLSEQKSVIPHQKNIKELQSLFYFVENGSDSYKSITMDDVRNWKKNA